jgi:hypothetical protein
MEFILIAVATAFNFLIIKWKLERGRYEDAVLDFLIFLALGYMFSGSFGGMVVATMSSAIISLAFWKNPPQFIGPLIKKAREIIE